MEILSIVSLILSVISFIDEIRSNNEVWKITIFSFAVILSFTSVLISLHEFFTSIRSKRKRIISGFLKLIYTDSYIPSFKLNSIKGKGIYCNPFKMDSSGCYHIRQLVFSETDDSIDFGSQTGNYSLLIKSTDNDFSHFDKIMSNNGYAKTRNTYSYKAWGDFDLDDINRFHFLKPSYEIHFFVEVDNIRFSCFFKTVLVNIQITSNLCEGSHVLNLETNFENFIYFCKFLCFVRDKNRSCCFVSNSCKKIRNSYLIHCFNFDIVFKRILLGEKIVYSDQRFGYKCSEGIPNEEEELILKFFRNKYRELSDCIIGYLNLKLRDKDEIILFIKALAFSESCNSKKKSSLLGNSKWKRICTDVSYIRERYGQTSMYGLTRKIEPSSMVKNHCDGLNVKEIESKYFVHYFPRDNFKCMSQKTKDYICENKKGDLSLDYYKYFIKLLDRIKNKTVMNSKDKGSLNPIKPQLVMLNKTDYFFINSPEKKKEYSDGFANICDRYSKSINKPIKNFCDSDKESLRAFYKIDQKMELKKVRSKESHLLEVDLGKKDFKKSLESVVSSAKDCSSFLKKCSQEFIESFEKIKKEKPWIKVESNKRKSKSRWRDLSKTESEIRNSRWEKLDKLCENRFSCLGEGGGSDAKKVSSDFKNIERSQSLEVKFHSLRRRVFEKCLKDSIKLKKFSKITEKRTVISNTREERKEVGVKENEETKKDKGENKVKVEVKVKEKEMILEIETPKPNFLELIEEKENPVSSSSTNSNNDYIKYLKETAGKFGMEFEFNEKLLKEKEKDKEVEKSERGKSKKFKIDYKSLTEEEKKEFRDKNSKDRVLKKFEKKELRNKNKREKEKSDERNFFDNWQSGFN